MRSLPVGRSHLPPMSPATIWMTTASCPTSSVYACKPATRLSRVPVRCPSPLHMRPPRTSPSTFTLCILAFPQLARMASAHTKPTEIYGRSTTFPDTHDYDRRH